MNTHFAPNPTFAHLPAYIPNATPEQIEAHTARMFELYSRYADSLDNFYPDWIFEILTMRNPARQLVQLAEERRQKLL